MVFQDAIEVPTRGRGFTAITDRVQQAVARSGCRQGLCLVFVCHTSASLVIQENADPDVRKDLEDFFQRLVPDGDPRYRHDAEGPDDMPAHIRSALTRTGETIAITGGHLDLGTWQGLYLWEHRTHGSARRLRIQIVGE